MGVDRQLRGLDPLLPHHAFEGGAGLPLVEHNGLGVEEAPTVAHVRVDAHRRGLPPRIDPRACQTRRLVSRLIMSADARSVRPQAVAMA